MAQYTTEVKIFPETLRTVDSATLAGAYVPIGAPLGKPIRIFKFVNDSNTEVTVSWDGVNDYDILPAMSFFLYDITTNRSNVEGSQGIYVASGTQFYIKGAAGVGNIYLACIG